LQDTAISASIAAEPSSCCGQVTVTCILSSGRVPVFVRADARGGAEAITPNGKTLYVISGQSGVVTPISTAANTALKPITVGSGPIAITIAAPYRH